MNVLNMNLLMICQARQDGVYIPRTHNHTALLAAHYMRHLFADPPSAVDPTYVPYLYALIDRMQRDWKSPNSLIFCTLVYLYRLKIASPGLIGSTTCGQRLFTAAFIVAAKMMCFDKFLNRHMVSVLSNQFTLQELNAAEREVCITLKYDFLIGAAEFSEFTTYVRFGDTAMPSKLPVTELRLVPVPSLFLWPTMGVSSSLHPIELVPPTATKAMPPEITLSQDDADGSSPDNRAEIDGRFVSISRNQPSQRPNSCPAIPSRVQIESSGPAEWT